MTDDLTEKIAEVLRLHPVTVDDRGIRCGCDPEVVRDTSDRMGPEDEDEFYRKHAQHQAVAVAVVVNAHNTVETVNEWEALPVGTVVRDSFGFIREKTALPQSWRTLGNQRVGFGVQTRILYRPNTSGGES